MRRFLTRLTRSRVVRIAAVLLVTATAAVAYALRDPAPVGYFRSADAHDRFMAAYRRAMAGMPVPDRTLDIRTGYGVVRLYHFTGASPDAAPVLLLPGRAAASPVWADNLPSLLAVRSVYTVDLLGEPGMSVQQRPIATAEDHARWLHEVLAALPEAEVHLLGLSIGGWTAMNLVVHEPQKVASVTVLDPVLVFADLSLQLILRSIPASIHWFPRAWRDGFNSWVAGDVPVEDEPVARMIEAGMQAYVLRLSVPARITEHELSRVSVPTLAVIAGSSRMHDSAQAAEVARRALPGVMLRVYPDASHAINGEYPDAIAADVAAFLDGIE